VLALEDRIAAGLSPRQLSSIKRGLVGVATTMQQPDGP
jgi:hypothetical protein